MKRRTAWTCLAFLILPLLLCACGTSAEVAVMSSSSSSSAVTASTTVSENGKTSTQAGETMLRFSDVGWDSIRFHNAVARFVLENAYGYKTEEISGTTPITYPALQQGDVDVLMEMWTDNVPTYEQDVADKKVLELSVNFDDDAQGVYVPRYVIEGDSERGVAPMAPDLKKVSDLSKYANVFADPEEPGKGRLYGAVSGWNIDKVLHLKYIALGLSENFTYFSPGSDAALAAAFTSAFEKGQAIAGYYWEPTWLTGKYDLVRLGDEPYDAKTFNDGIGDFPAVRVTICANPALPEKAPDAAAFLQHYKTSSELTATALAYMNDTKADYLTTAKWFLKENQTLWADWLPADACAKVRDALK